MCSIVVLTFCALLGLGVGETDILKQWDKFLQLYNKTYTNVREQQHRFVNFQRNARFAYAWNAVEEGTAVYGITKFSDFSEEEFRMMNGVRKPAILERYVAANRSLFSNSQKPLPAHFDWREHNVVTRVKDQANCGSCWAFAAVGSIESVAAIKSKKLIALSEQQIVDCDPVDYGCNGGWPLLALESVVRFGGLQSEEQYQYKAKDGVCLMNRSDVAVKVDGAIVLSQDEEKIARYLLKHGPVTASFNPVALFQYKGGILKLNEFDCPLHMWHAVVIVGFGTENDVPYWIVKNSWGADWGENGYFRIFRGDNTCNIANCVVGAFIAD